MAAVYVQASSSSSSSSSYITSRGETFTLWMKSLVFHGKGCAVFDSEGKLVYRIDNYCGNKSIRDDVDLMDLAGNVLFSLQPQKKTPVFGSYSWDGCKVTNKVEERTLPCFHVRKNRRVLKGSIDYYDVVSHGIEGDETTTTTTMCYRIQGSSGKTGFRITDGDGKLLAEVEQKRSSSTGVLFGKDVLSLVVEAEVDHSLIMAFVSAHQLINNNL